MGIKKLFRSMIITNSALSTAKLLQKLQQQQTAVSNSTLQTTTTTTPTVLTKSLMDGLLWFILNVY